jgi:hypothetical protein
MTCEWCVQENCSKCWCRSVVKHCKQLEQVIILGDNYCSFLEYGCGEAIRLNELCMHEELACTFPTGAICPCAITWVHTWTCNHLLHEHSNITRNHDIDLFDKWPSAANTPTTKVIFVVFNKIKEIKDAKGKVQWMHLFALGQPDQAKNTFEFKYKSINTKGGGGGSGVTPWSGVPMWMSTSCPTMVQSSACTTFGRSWGSGWSSSARNDVVVSAGTGLHERSSRGMKVPIVDRSLIVGVCQDIRELCSGFSSLCVEWIERPILSGCWWLFMRQSNPIQRIISYWIGLVLHKWKPPFMHRGDSNIIWSNNKKIMIDLM